MRPRLAAPAPATAQATAQALAPAMALVLLAGALAGCTQSAVEARARPGDFVVLDLVAWDEAGREVENATGAMAVMGPEVPPRLPPGWAPETTRSLPPGVVRALAGATAGIAVPTPLLPAAEAYGNWSAERTIRAPRVQDLPPEVDLDASALVGARGARWANQSWEVEVLERNGTTARVRLLGGPAPGAALELPPYWNEHYRLWTSRFVAIDAAALRVEHVADLGRQASVGGVWYTVTRAGGTGTAGTAGAGGADGTGGAPRGDEVVADGNPPLAGQALRFRAALRSIAFAGGAGHPEGPDAVLVAVDGLRFNVSDLRGRVVLLDFFATWCVTCKQQVPILARAREHFGANLTIVSVTIDPTDSEARIAAFREDGRKATQGTWGRPIEVDWMFAFDPTGEASKGYSVATLPRVVLLDPEGRIRATSSGLHPWPELRDDVAATLAGAAG